MSREIETKTTKWFRISEGEIKGKLGLTGRIVKMELWSGLSPNDEGRGVSHDKSMWQFETVQSSNQKVKNNA